MFHGMNQGIIPKRNSNLNTGSPCAYSVKPPSHIAYQKIKRIAAFNLALHTVDLCFCYNFTIAYTFISQRYWFCEWPCQTNSLIFTFIHTFSLWLLFGINSLAVDCVCAVEFERLLCCFVWGQSHLFLERLTLFEVDQFAIRFVKYVCMLCMANAYSNYSTKYTL